jgi:hypothetical protein
MPDDPENTRTQMVAEARQKSLEDDAEIEAWKARSGTGFRFFLPSAKGSLWVLDRP